MSQWARTRRLVPWLLLLLALVLPLASAAAEDEEADAAEAEDEGEAAAESEEIDWEVTHRGLYLLASGSYAFMVNRSDLESKAEHAANTGPANSNTDDSWGYGGRIGWRVMDRLAIEGQFQMLNSIEVKSHQESTGRNRRSRATFMTAMANAKGYLLTERVQPYALAGVGYGYGVLRPPGGGTNDRDQGFAAQFGVGTDFYVTDDVGLMTEVSYTMPTGDIDEYDNVAILFGLMFRFHGN